MGGPLAFVNRPEMTFQLGTTQGGGMIFNQGKEPSFTMPYLYNYVNRQDLSVLRSRNIAKQDYQATVSGLPGNSDAGAMESWVVWNMLDLYLVTRQTTFLIGSPWSANTSISLGDDKMM